MKYKSESKEILFDSKIFWRFFSLNNSLNIGYNCFILSSLISFWSLFKEKILKNVYLFGPFSFISLLLNILSLFNKFGIFEIKSVIVVSNIIELIIPSCSSIISFSPPNNLSLYVLFLFLIIFKIFNIIFNIFSISGFLIFSLFIFALIHFNNNLQVKHIWSIGKIKAVFSAFLFNK